MDLLTEFEPDADELAVIVKRRLVRKYQRKSRGDKRSANDEFENAAIVAAWEGGELTEGQAMRALSVDRVSAREIRLRVVALGRALATELA